MSTEQLLILIGGLLTSVLGYFLIKTMDELKATTKQCNENTNSIALLKQETGLKHERLEEKLDELKDSIQDLTAELKTYNKGK